MINADNFKDKIFPFFDCFYDSLIYAYFENKGGTAFADNSDKPQVAVIVSGDFYFVSGEINKNEICEIMDIIGDNKNAVIVPDKPDWFEYMCKVKPLKIVKRFHTCLPDNFDKQKIERISEKINQKQGFKIAEIDEYYYNKSLAEDWSKSFVCNFKNFEDFNKNGFGFVIVNGNQIISGTSTFFYCSKGVEVEVATRKEFQNQGFASVVSARFILECLKRGVSPFWDARNRTSLTIAQKFGFVFRDEYTAFEFI